MTNSLLSENNDDQNSFDSNQDALAVLTGPGGKYDRTKYATEEDMYKAIAHGKLEADHFIKIKNSQFDDLRKDYDTMRESATTQAKIQELLDKWDNRSQSNSNDNNTLNREEDNKPSLKTEDIEAIFAKKMQENKIAETQQTNFNKVQEKLRERFGHNTDAVLRDKYASLGLSAEDGDALAKKSPEAFFNILGLNNTQQESFSPPPASYLNNNTFKPSGNKRTWSYYQEMKKKDPKTYYLPQTAVQMQKDYNELGASFEDGDFNRFN